MTIPSPLSKEKVSRSQISMISRKISWASHPISLGVGFCKISRKRHLLRKILKFWQKGFQIHQIFLWRQFKRIWKNQAQGHLAFLGIKLIHSNRKIDQSPEAQQKKWIQVHTVTPSTKQKRITKMLPLILRTKWMKSKKTRLWISSPKGMMVVQKPRN